jgi:hypothetical protein
VRPDRLRFGTDQFEARLEDLDLPAPSVLATIWATVDIERSAGDLGLPCEELQADPHLGARVCLVRSGDGVVALAEPVTEGRLARHLARHDEGPAGVYVAWPGDYEDVLRRFRRAGAVLSTVAGGPFGPSVLVISGPGANCVIVEPPPATIEP